MPKLILIYAKKLPFLTETQLERLASICADIAQLTVASVVIPFFRSSEGLFIYGTMTSLAFWGISLYIERKRSDIRS